MSDSLLSIPLAVHLENGQRVYFTEQTAMERATARPPPTTLSEFFALCQRDAFAQTLTYADVPRFYTWDQGRKVWSRRKQGSAIVSHPGIFAAQSFGRVYTVSPRQGESYYLRLLLHEVKGPQILMMSRESLVLFVKPSMRLAREEV